MDKKELKRAIDEYEDVVERYRARFMKNLATPGAVITPEYNSELMAARERLLKAQDAAHFAGVGPRMLGPDFIPEWKILG